MFEVGKRLSPFPSSVFSHSFTLHKQPMECYWQGKKRGNGRCTAVYGIEQLRIDRLTMQMGSLTPTQGFITCWPFEFDCLELESCQCIFISQIRINAYTMTNWNDKLLYVTVEHRWAEIELDWYNPITVICMCYNMYEIQCWNERK